MARQEIVPGSPGYPVYDNETGNRGEISPGIFINDTGVLSYTMSADVGAFTLAGQAARLRGPHDFLIQANAGAFVLNGNPAGLTWSGAPPSTGGVSGPHFGMFGLGLGQWAIAPSGGSSFLATTRVVGTRGDVPGGVSVIATDITRGKTYRTRHFIGGRDVTEIKLAFGGYYTGIADGEHNLGNAYTVEAAIEIPSLNATHRVTFDGGSNTGTVVDGAGIYISDALLPAAFGLATFPANEQIWIRRSVAVVNGENILVAENSAATPAIVGEGAIQYDPSAVVTNQIDATGILTATGGATSYTSRLYPLAILGKTVSAELAVGGPGDSIQQYFDDNIGDGVNGSGGWFQRGLVSVNGRHVPYVRMARASERASNYAVSTKRIQLYPYLTHMISNYGVNDLNAGRTPAQILADLRTIWTAAHVAGLQRIEQILVGPWTSSTDTWTTIVNQTNRSANIAVVNANTIANIGANGLDATLFLAPAISDPGDPTKWAVNGTPSFLTNDGLHPSPVACGLMAPLFTTRVATWVAT